MELEGEVPPRPTMTRQMREARVRRKGVRMQAKRPSLPILMGVGWRRGLRAGDG